MRRSLLASSSLTWTSFPTKATFASALPYQHSISSSSLFMSTSSSSSSSSSSQTFKNSSSRPLRQLRDMLTQKGIDAFIVPTDDPHMSEYTSPFFARREYISGFTGSAGTAVVMAQGKSMLFCDGRYHTQADLEVDAQDWTVMKLGIKGVPTLQEFLSNFLAKGSTVGVDPALHAADGLKNLMTSLQSKSIHVKLLTNNPIDTIWDKDQRPSAPQGLLRQHPLQFSGKSVAEKLLEIRELMNSNGVTALAVTALDEIAWLFNIRGCDVPCNPVAVAYALVTMNSAILFIDEPKAKPVASHLTESGVTIMPYEKVTDVISSLAKGPGNPKIWVDTKTSNYLIYTSIPETQRFEKNSPIVLMKAKKNDAELLGMRACHLRDGAAMAEFMSWLEDELNTRSVSEVEVDEKVTACRAAAGGFIEPSFPTIAGVNENGAIIHYRAVIDMCKQLTKNDMLLLDSGGQYEDGTTDVTRTIHTGTPSALQRELFTRVLKGNIAIDSRVFPAGTPGCLLDAYAREHLWAVGKDFIHGVGHGVGAALNVHEGPHRISRALDPQPLLPGMVVSNEPGFYDPSLGFGIRIENLLVVVPRNDLPEFAGRPFYGFDKLTHIPIQKKLIDHSLLTSKEVEWINNYHRQVWEKVGPLVKTDRARAWLKQACEPLSV